MGEHEFDEFTEMLIIYGETGYNGRSVQRMFHESFPHRLKLSNNFLLSKHKKSLKKQISSKLGRLTLVLFEPTAPSAFKTKSSVAYRDCPWYSIHPRWTFYDPERPALKNADPERPTGKNIDDALIGLCNSNILTRNDGDINLIR